MNLEETRAIRVDLPGAHSDIRIGPNLLEQTGAFLGELAQGGPVLLVTDDIVSDLYSGLVVDSLADAGFEPSLACIRAGEERKSLDTVKRIYQALLDLGADRGTPVVALGGGVVTDLTGFAAATFLRGLPWMALPTTLLAQVDASVGGKTGVNLPDGKNLVGAFHHPRVVLADVGTLATLNEREFRSGLAEVAKMALALDRDLLELLRARTSPPGPGSPAAELVPIVAACIAEKARVVMEDEREADLRRVLNFGHTAGHAIEAAAGYEAVRHGEAVAVGMAAALNISTARGLLTEDDRDQALALLRALELLTTLADLPKPVNKKDLEKYLLRDKKRREGRLSLVLLRALGTAEIVPDGTAEEVLAAIPG